MTQRLNRNLTGEDALQPGEWCTSPDVHIDRTMITVTLSCPLCGAKRRLDHRHVVARDGKVTPAFACLSCPLIEWIELTSWGEQ